MAVYMCLNGHPPERMILSRGFHRCPICGMAQPDPEIIPRALRGRKPHRLPDDLNHELRMIAKAGPSGSILR